MDANQQWRELAENYAALVDEELEAIALQAYDLTDIARQALQAEISRRHLNIELQLRAPDTEEQPSLEEELPLEKEGKKPRKGYPPGFDPEDWGLVNFTHVEDIEEARKIKACFDDAGIPSYYGPDLVDDLRLLPPSFKGALRVKVREVDSSRARAVRNNCAPPPESGEEEELTDYSVHCPKCNSAEVVFQGLDESDPDSAVAPKYTWSCEACGHQWKDDGVEAAT